MSGEAPTGRQFTITHGPWLATAVEVGGGLRTLSRDGVAVLAGYEQDEQCRSGRGQQLMPWPNRIRDGKYAFAGRDQQLSITEVPRHNAMHGLVRWALWELVEQGEHHVVLGYRLHPQPGWPHRLDLRTTYTLDDDGLSVTVSARNLGDGPAPFGYGAHPYLSIGSVAIAEARLTVPASRWVEVDDRMLPVGTRRVDDTRYDFRTARAVGSELLDTAYTEIERDEHGRWRCTVSSEPLGTVSLWADESFPWLQVFTGAALHHKGEPGVAIEPMSCPADAFNSGTSLVVLDSGDEWTGTWGVTTTPTP